MISLAPSTSPTQPAIGAIVNSTDGSANIQPGSFITVKGKNLASAAKALTAPAPTVLGGSCVTFGDIAAPLLQTSSGQILAQVPSTILPGTQVVEVRSLGTAQDSAPVLLAVRAAGGGTKSSSGIVAEPVRERLPGARRC